MNNSTFRIATIAFVVGLLVSLFGCMDASLSQSGNAPASISIQDAPDAIPEVGVSITGGGANISETVGPGTDALVFELSVGNEHEVTIDATNYIGRKSFVLPPGGAQVDVQMLEKLFVPEQRTGRLVRLDTIRTPNWQEIDTDNLSPSNRPYDAEIGPDGRIYTVTTGDGDQILAYESIEDLTPDAVGTAFGGYAIGIDHNAEVMYSGGDGGDGPFLQRSNLDGTVVEDLSDLITSIFQSSVWGISVDDAGAIYVSGLDQGDPEAPAVAKIGSNRSEVVWVTSLEAASEFDTFQTDVVAIAGSIYVANPRGVDGQKIVKLDPASGNVLDSFGSFPAQPDNPKTGELFGPRRFVAVNNRRLTVIDEYAETGTNIDRLVQFGLDGSGWSSFGTTGTAEGEFQFFEHSFC
jgi:DNA-binding beta-propeller fold protein YncE